MWGSGPSWKCWLTRWKRSGNMAADLQQVIAGERFDRARAQGVVDQKLQAVQQHSPKVVDAMASFYDSLDAGQQRVVREKLKERFGDRK